MTKPAFSIVLICRNEEKTIPRMFASLKDYVARGGDVNIVDTGSTDRSVEVARSLGIRVQEVGTKYLHTIDETLARLINDQFVIENEYPVVNPGETYFDFSSARNAAAAMADCDMVSTMDCDEVLTRLNIDKIDEYIRQGFTQFEYNFIFSHLADGSPFVQFIQSKFYDRRIVSWSGIIHEMLQGPSKIKLLNEDEFILEHYQNVETNRSGYLRGLAVDCYLNQDKDRNSHYAAREFWYNGRPWTAAKEFKRHIEMNKWPAERAESMLFLADIYGAMEKPEEQLYWAHRALDTEPNRREPLIKLAQIYSRRKEWVPANFYAVAALELPWYPFYGANKNFYSTEPHEIIFNAAGWQGNIPRAQEHLLKCLEYSPYHPGYLDATKFFFPYACPNIEGWMRYPELLWLFTTAQKMESVLEVGSWQGRSSHALLSGCKGKVTCVDTFLGTDDPNDGTYQQGARLDVYGKFMASVGHFKNLEVLRMTSEEAAKAVGDRKFDMVFLDANHTEKGLKKDIELWKDKANLILCGHDYGSGWPGVQAAVDIQLGGYDEIHDTIWVKNLVNPLISICIPTLGRKDKLNRLLKSIKENAGYENYEIVIEEDQMPPNNLGAPKMLAKCLLRARGEHILFLGNDCVVEPNLLQELVWQMARSFPEQDGMVGINDNYWQGDKGHVATHFLISKKLIDQLDGEIFHVGYHHCGGDNELLCRASAIDKYVWCEKAKIFHDHPINSGFAWSDPLYEQAYAGPRHDADNALYKERAEKYGFADRKWD